MRPAPRALVVLACAALALITAPGRWVDPVLAATAPGAPVVGARLTAITALDRGARTEVVIEASEPVAFVTTQPGPLTVFVDLRNVSARGALNTAMNETQHLAGVSLEEVTSPDGLAVARIRVQLRAPAVHRVRSAGNLIRVEIDRARIPEARATSDPIDLAGLSSSAVQPATSLDRVRATTTAQSVSIVLSGNGRLLASSVQETGGVSARLVLDFPNVTASAQPTTWISQDPVDKVRVALNQRSPALTRVVIDLSRRATYRLETEGEGGRDVRIVFDKGSSVPADSTPGPLQAQHEAAFVAEAPVDLLTVLGDSSVREAGSALVSSTMVAAPFIDSPPVESATAPAIQGQSLFPAPAPAPTLTARQIAATAAQRPGIVVAAFERTVGVPGGIWAPANRLVSATPALVVPQVNVTVPPEPARLPAPQLVAAQEVTPTVIPTPPAPVMETMVPPQVGQVRGERTFTGHPVSLDFQGADLRAVLRTFAEISGLNLVIDPSVTGSVDVTLRDVPWDQALDLILRANKLGYGIEGTIVRIAPLTVLADEEAQRRKLSEEQALAGTLSVVTKPLSYARAEDIRTLITRSALTPRGEVEVDARTNTLIIRDLPAAIQVATDLIAILDTPQPQVEIEARIVQTNRDFARSLGVQWGVSARATPALGNTLPLAFPNQGSITGRTGDVGDTAVNLGVTGASSALGLSLGSVNGAINLDVALSALERSGKGRLLSTPRVSTQNNVEAEITQGVQIPIQTVANNTVTVTFKDAALTLKVMPQITASGTVIMRISVENATPDFTRQVNNIPPINTQRALTQVLVRDGETTVIGGIYTSSETSSNERTPALHRIPLLGWLFKRDIVNDESRELLIFITPRIIS